MNVVLLDRDGTVIVDPPDKRVDNAEKIALFPDTIEALRYFAQHDFAVIFVTNQAGIGEGRLTAAKFESLHQKVKALLAPSGVSILETFVCPHTPQDNCECRKPKPTLLLQAISQFQLDPAHTFFVGDRQTDVAAGINAGVRTILMSTGEVAVQSPLPEYVAANLLDAARYVVASTPKAT